MFRKRASDSNNQSDAARLRNEFKARIPQREDVRGERRKRPQERGGA